MSTVIDGSASVTINSGAILGITSSTAVTLTTQTSVDFTSIPSWVKRVTVMLSGVSLSTTASLVNLRIGSGSVETTGYIAGYGFVNSSGTANAITSTTYMPLCGPSNAAETFHGFVSLINVTGNTWVLSGSIFRDGTVDGSFTPAGSKTTSGVLDRLQVVLDSTGAFDAGTVNIMYEG